MVRKLSDRLPKRDSPARFWMHVPAGIGTVLAITVSPLAAIMVFVAFLVYEIVEDWRIGDHGYIDVAGFIGGIWAGIVILFVIQKLEWLGSFPGGF